MMALRAAKAALYGIFLNYYCYYVLNGSFIPGGTVLFLGISVVFVGIDMLNQRCIMVSDEIKCWILYAILAFITTGILTFGSKNSGYVGDIIKYVQRLAIIIMICYICQREGSIRFGLQLMAVTAIAASISILTVVDDIQLKLSISTEANLSANDIGAIMAFGCFAVLFCLGKRNKPSFLLSALKVAAIISIVAVIFIAGSRKSITAVVIMLVLLAVLCFPDYVRQKNIKQLLITVVIGVIAYSFVSQYLLPYAEQTNLYTRLLGKGAQGASSSDEIRIDLYKWALQDFWNHPLFGLGFNQYVKAHGNYTHSTYAEPLACSGLIGLLYLYPYYSMLKKQIYLIWRTPKKSLERLKQKEIFVYYCMFLFVGVGIPYMYKDVPCILLGTFLGSQAISFEEIRTQGRTSINY